MSILPGHSPTVPPMPPSTADIARWEETRRRRRMLSGRWAPDLETRLRQHFGSVRRGVIGPKSLAKNAYRKLCNELAVNYNRTPKGRGLGAAADTVFGREGLLATVGMWPIMRRAQVQIIGLREYLLREDYSAELERPVLRMVPPDGVVAWAHASAPSVPVEIWELRWRVIPGGKTQSECWAWDQLSIADPANPFFRVVEAKADGKLGEDFTRVVLGDRYEGGAYPFRWTRGPRAGQPFLPYTLYHAMYPEQLWDFLEGIEVVDSSLDVATAYTFLQHSIFKASFPLRWALGAHVAGVAPRDTAAGPRSEVPTDPTSLLHLQPNESGVQAQIGQWGAGMDVESLARTVGILERAMADFDGLDSSHIVHDTANPWSAAALSITREGKRAAQEKYQVSLAPADCETIEKLCAIANLEGYGPGYDEGGYSVEYQMLPLSAIEADAKRTHNGELVAAGRMSIVEAYMDEHPGVSRAEAEAELQRIAEENKQFNVVAGTRPAPVAIDPNTPAPPAGA